MMPTRPYRCMGDACGNNTVGTKSLCPSCEVKWARLSSTDEPQPPLSPTDDPGEDYKATLAQLRAEMDDLKQYIREFGTKMHEFADLLLRAGRQG